MSPSTKTRDRVWVLDAMRHGTLTCQAETPLRTVARMMSEHRVHAIVVTYLDGVSERAWGIVSDVDLLGVIGGDLDRLTAGDAAATELLMVDPGQDLEAAARTMAEHEVSHVVVVDRGKPIGVLSSLDVAAAIAD
jgi:CBS domain-containing protein